MTHYDLAIIGSGSGNSLITDYWADKKVAIIDGGTFGGTCLNFGCIPTKMYVYPARLAGAVAEASTLGVDLSLRDVRWREIRDRIFGRIDAISEGGRRYRDVELDNVTLYSDYATFTGPGTLQTASGDVISADQIVVAAGSRAVLPEVPGIDLPQVHTSDTVMRIDELPARVLVVGGGYIAAEFAGIFAGFGSKVTQINRSGPLLKSQDQLVSERYTARVAGQLDLRLGRTLAGITANDDGSVTAALDADGRREDIVVDLVLIATGRIPNSDLVGARTAGFDVSAAGQLAVDKYQRVLSGGLPVEGVWALGDVSSDYQLKHVANHEARTVAHNLTGPEELAASDHRFVPSAVFSHPEIASVGLTEAQARAGGEQIVTAVQEYGSTAYGWAMDDGEGFVKLIAAKSSGRLLGAHIMGYQASMLIQPLIQAMSFGLTAGQMARGQYWIHPALTEVVENALLSLEL